MVKRILDIAETKDDATALRAAQTVVAMEGQNQADDHAREKNERLDAGKLTERFSEPVIIERPVRPGTPEATS